MSKKGINWNSERILSLSAMSISFITLIIFIYQTNLMSKQNDLSILPYLQLSTSDNPADNRFSLSLKNHGVGPAIIESVSLEYNGKRSDLKDYENYLANYLKSIAPALDSINNLDISSLDKGIAIPANTTYLVLDVINSERDYRLITENLQHLEKNGLKYEIVYKSIQNERWKITENSEGPEKLD